MPLQSRFFKGEPALEACLVRDAAHITRGASGDHVSIVQQAITILEGDVIDAGDISSRMYGGSTANAVLEYKRKRDIVNRSYQTQADDIVGKMTIQHLDDDLVAKEAGNPDFTGFTDAQIDLIKRDIGRSRAMLDVVLRRLRIIAATTPSGGLLVTPRTLSFYDTKLKVLNVFRINTFRDDDLPIPDDILAQLRTAFRGLVVPPPSHSPSDAFDFSTLLENFARLRRAMDELFPKLFYPKATFKGEPLGFFAAFVDATNPSDSTVRFTRRYFDANIVDDDGRAVTLAHERAHTVFRANGHPGTGDQPFCVAPHLGDPNVKTSAQALANPYCYEWLIYALQPEYNAAKHRGPECGT